MKKYLNTSKNHGLWWLVTIICLLLFLLLWEECQCIGHEVGHECRSLDIRNECRNFLKLSNCTVITGYLIIVLLPLQKSGESCDLEHYSFPLLREITDFLLFHEVRNVTSLRGMFPNLTVIRGQQLFLNYALGITYMNELQSLEFGSLIAIQRGHIIIGNNPKLCHLDRINWDRLTLTAGENHIFSLTSPTNNWCPANSSTQCPTDCTTDYCWSPEVCQYFEHDQLHSDRIGVNGIGNCSELCLGGCHPLHDDDAECRVCRSWTDHGKCVEKCPRGLFAFEHYLRCYTREECIDRGGLIHQDQCLETCPTAYKLNRELNECKRCNSEESCRKICTPLDSSQPFWIYSLGDLDALKGCQILNGSVLITLRNRIDETDLLRGFADVQEIQGHLKIYKSHHLSSLQFLRNLHKIHGHPLENERYALVLYNNRRIRELWAIETTLELSEGGMYIHLNNRLCNRHLKPFLANVIHDRSLDSLQSSEEEILCDPAKLNLQIKILKHDAVELFWPIVQTSDNIVIVYRPSQKWNVNESKDLEQNEWDSDPDINICERNIWKRITRRHEDVPHNLTHYRYTIGNLEANSYYTFLLKTFSQYNNEQENIRSELQQIRTELDLPPMPSISIKGKTDNTLTIHLDGGSFRNLQLRTKSVIDYFMVELFDMFSQEMTTIRRNYCLEPAKSYPLAILHSEGCEYENHLQELAEHFDELMREQYSCARNHLAYCEANRTKDEGLNASVVPTWPPSQSKRLEPSETSHTFKYLERFRLYRIEARACNRLGCGSVGMVTGRTNYSLVADRIHDLSACLQSCALTSEHHEFHIHFTAPQHPNGLITSYSIHLRNVSNSNLTTMTSHCISSEEHSRLQYPQPWVLTLNQSFEQIAVQTHSLAGYTFTDWINVSCPCPKHEDIFQQPVNTSTKHSRGMTVFVTFFVLGVMATVLWICHKRRYWRTTSFILLRRHLPVLGFGREILEQGFASQTTDDRQILVEAFDSVHYQNTPGAETLNFSKIQRIPKN